MITGEKSRIRSYSTRHKTWHHSYSIHPLPPKEEYIHPLKLHGENRPKTLRNPAKSIGGNWLKKENLLPKKKKIRSLFPL
jgi:hypothetical protein